MAIIIQIKGRLSHKKGCYLRFSVFVVNLIGLLIILALVQIEKDNLHTSIENIYCYALWCKLKNSNIGRELIML